jgi:NAD(P)-dependent dehydrogenase (short-subunit alcohol dehydrogenase family)
VRGRFHGRVALVTGSARGIGRAVAVRLASEGAAVIVNDILPLDGAVADCRAAGGEVEAVQRDIARPGAAEALVARARDRFGGLHVVVNNAFWEERAPLLDVSREGWDRTLQVSLTAAMLVARAALPALVAAGGGAIVNIASVHALGAGPGFAPYEAAKAGLISLTRSIAVEHGRQGVRCNAVCPGLVITERNRAWWLEDPPRLQAVQAAYPVGRVGTPEDVAAVVAFLASEEAAFVNGASLAVDGGMTAMLAETAALHPFGQS